MAPRNSYESINDQSAQGYRRMYHAVINQACDELCDSNELLRHKARQFFLAGRHEIFCAGCGLDVDYWERVSGMREKMENALVR